MDNINSSQKVSIIIPVYNVEQYLRQCLDSVCNQTFKDIEIIVVNDCSPDNSLQIIKEYQLKDDRIVLIDLQENKGVSNARNEGLKIAKGKYITFVDSDDWVTKDFVEILYNAIEKYNTDFVCSDYFYVKNNEVINRKGISVNLIYNKVLSEERYKREYLQHLKFISIVQVWNKIFKKDFFSSNNFDFKTRIHEDNIFMWKALIKAKNFAFIKDRLYFYRLERDGSLTATLKEFRNKFSLYNSLKLLHQSEEYKKYITDLNTYMVIDTCYYIERVSGETAKAVFSDFKTLFFNKDFKLNYKYINLRNKIRLLIFSFCIKCNINYAVLGQIHHRFNPIRIFTKRNDLNKINE